MNGVEEDEIALKMRKKELRRVEKEKAAAQKKAAAERQQIEYRRFLKEMNREDPDFDKMAAKLPEAERLANEQARYQIAFRHDLAELADELGGDLRVGGQRDHEGGAHDRDQAVEADELLDEHRVHALDPLGIDITVQNHPLVSSKYFGTGKCCHRQISDLVFWF